MTDTNRPHPPTDPDPVVRSQADLERLWRTLMQPLGFRTTSTWLLIVDRDDRPFRQLTEIAGSHDLPDDEQLEGFGEMLTMLTTEVVPGGRVAFLRTRPGRGGVVDHDREWAAVLYAAARRAGVPCEVVHVATDTDLWPVPLDDLAVRRSA